MKYILLLLLFFFSSAFGKDIGVHAFTAFDTSENFSSANGYGVGKDGVLYFSYGHRYNNLGDYRNPTFVANFANILYREILNGDSSKRALFFKQVNYLLESAVEDKAGYYWAFPFENTYYDAPLGWWSAMTSDRVLGVLARAHKLSGEKKYLEFANKVLDKLALSVDKGGMSTHLENGGIWLEEVAYHSSPSYKVLNGHIFALAGVYDFAHYTNSGEAKKLLEGGVKAVRDALQDYDAGFISYYSSANHNGHRSYAGRGDYNGIHVMQMLWLYEISNDSSFLKEALRFQSYELNYGVVTASASTNVATHGPDKMDLRFGNNYWSSSIFPVSVIIDLQALEAIKSVGLLGHSVKGSPRDYTVSISKDNENWQKVAKVVGNADDRFVVPFTYLVTARYIKFDILSDNGNRNVALDGVAVFKANPEKYIVDRCNYSVSLKKLSDGDHSTGIPVRCAGWLLIPKSEVKKEVLHIDVKRADVSGVASLELEYSNDLISWKQLSRLPVNDRSVTFEKIPEASYYRVKFDQAISVINEFY
ncbi:MULTISPECIES: D-glucuronyl C5-epimerase family protein [unclassified Pseudomonas]|uniref:D-glucuronyl C5-epimerase family protein n=1 Tax=unclassified Pseudomonas TaxID=196821 RepID=UPI0011A42419|nr:MULTISPECIES: D-glucuronyl C5-epimerase family protein [unclassified Pseudomonas]TWC18883.1 F5/8 type C domain-containing protein [Pseudomonas sp. SJZ075]TWC33319.1 F5/8 type C domain-containing protein [Pseudomonas sp. SJZ078]TWC55923.1 F5/8 type C domain-containing protein [Pseudomonas sp. SJZ124]TWC91466.1 F5/8 type C domain-containing protein [Pseudomonas sp. SJZ101]